MVTRTVAALIAAGLVVLSPAPASAKGLQQELTIVSGPGLEEPLILEREDWGVPRNESSPQAVLIEGLLGGPAPAIPPPKEDRGPAYEIRYQVSALNPGDPNWPIFSIVRQRLHPYAEGGPVAYLPSQFWRNPFGPNRIQPRWQSFPPALVERLHRFGLPERPPTPSGAAPAGAALPLGLAAVGIALAAVVGRRRDPLLAV